VRIMRYAILGAGAMGSIIGAALAKSGQDVTLIDPYQEHMDTIRQQGLLLTMNQHAEIVRMNTCTDPHQAGPVDIIVLLVKRIHSAVALEGARDLIRENTYVCTLQNGLGNTELIEQYVPKDRILHGVMRIAGRMNGPGDVSGELAGGTAVYVGSLTKENTVIAMAQQVAADLTSGGLPSQFKSDVKQDIWTKAVNNICFNAPCGLLHLRIREYFSHPDGKQLVDEIAKETIQVAKAEGVVLDYQQIMRDLETNVIPAIGDHYPSLAQDMGNKRKTEIDCLNGAIVKYGRKLGIPTPVNDYITRLVKIAEDNY
jgi:2-dehydropantoate 2-reductase